MKRARKSKTPRWKDGSAHTHLLSTCVRLHMRNFTMSLKTIGSGSHRGFWCIQEVIEKCSHANVCMFQHVFAKKLPRTGASEGSCKFLYERFGGKRGSWWIQQRCALRRQAIRADPTIRIGSVSHQNYLRAPRTLTYREVIGCRVLSDPGDSEYSSPAGHTWTLALDHTVIIRLCAIHLESMLYK